MENTPLKDGSEGTGVTYTAPEMKSNKSSESESAFICNVCLEVTSKDPVVTQCGHLYCWPCLYRWLNTNHSTCPVCKAGVTKENVIPLFIRGSEEDPRTKSQSAGSSSVPNRPNAQRPEPTANIQTGLGNNNNLQYGVVTFSAGFGFFPSLFGLQFQSFPNPVRDPNRPMNEEELQQVELQRVLYVLGALVLLALIFF